MPSEKIPVGTPYPEVSKSFEDFLSQEIPRQHEACVASLRNVGLLEEIVLDQADIAIDMREGITGMDGKKYELPSAEKIAKHFSAEKYREKIEQGFTKLLIVPFGYPYATLRIRYEEQLLKHSREGTLLDRDNRHLGFNAGRPTNTFDHTDVIGSMIYYPKQFDRINHGGKTKQELLDDKSQPFPGFHVLLIKSDLTIPREGAGKTIGTRKDIEANKSCIDYLKLLTEPQYRGERGSTLEDSTVLAMIHLDQTNQVIDDFDNKKDSNNFNIGNFELDGIVLNTCWNRYVQEASVSFDGPGTASEYSGVRLVVS